MVPVDESQESVIPVWSSIFVCSKDESSSVQGQSIGDKNNLSHLFLPSTYYYKVKGVYSLSTQTLNFNSEFKTKKLEDRRRYHCESVLVRGEVRRDERVILWVSSQ